MFKTAVAISALLAAGALGAGLAAHAQEQTTSPGISGTIQTVDPTGRTITLDDGQTYTLGADADMSTFQTGSMVDLSCDAGNINCTTQSSGGISGTIQTVDPTGRTVTLDDGQTYTFGADADMSTLQTGSMVDLSCDAGNANCTAQTPGTTGNAAETTSPEQQTEPSAGDAATGGTSGAMPEAGTDATGSSTDSSTSN